MISSRIVSVLLVILSIATEAAALDWNDIDDSISSSGSSSFGSSSLDADSTPTPHDVSTSSSGASVSASFTPTPEGTSMDTEVTATNKVTPATAKSTVTSTYRNWVGPWSMSSDSSTSCYREAHIMNKCPSNYDRNKLTDTCWTECPYGYPLECGMECARQNSDCTVEISSKVSAVALTAFDLASLGIVGEFLKLGKKVTRAAKCGNTLLTVTRGIIRYVRNVKTEDPQTSQAKLLLMLYQTNNVVTDLPIAIYTCMGKAVPHPLRVSQVVLATSQWLLLQILSYDDSIISSWRKFKAFMKGANFTEAAEEITDDEVSSLETAMQSNSTCGADLKSLTDRTWMTIGEYRVENPDISNAEIRLKISESDLVLYDVATVTNNCMSQLIAESSVETAYKTRDTLRKTFGVIINDLIKSGKIDNGSSLDEKEMAYKWIDNGLSTISATMLDITDISTLLSEYIQTICGPTQFMGEIDDGTEDATLGLNTLQKAFKGSSLSWTRVGDGQVIINFSSNDTEDVSVNIMSGGDKVNVVDVVAGGTATWKSTIKALGGKTLYLDRWRPGFLGLPGTGGGSLLLWVPIAHEGGHLEVEVQLNVS